MTALEAEQQDNMRVLKAEEFLAYCREKENEARRTLAECIAQTKRSKEKYEEAFRECERRAVARRASGQIVNTID